MIRNLFLTHMTGTQLTGTLTGTLLALFALGCESGGVGEPCTPEDEYQASFSGFQATEVNVESRSFQCETRVCLVNHFQGRVSCPYGQTAEEAANGTGLCEIPGSEDKVTVAVDPQNMHRRTTDAVYCSCRCDGPQSNARYCECPSGYGCVKLVDEIGVSAGGQLAGSYCIKDNTTYSSTGPKMPCSVQSKLCGEVDGS